MKRVLFIDRDGTLAHESSNFQLDSFDKLEFLPGVFSSLAKIKDDFDFEFVMVTNQDGLGTSSFPEDTFWPTHNFIIKAFLNEGIEFSEILIDKSIPSENSPNRKPETGMLQKYINSNKYDLLNSYVIGDRLSDMDLAKNIGSKGILINSDLKKALEYDTNSNESIVFKTTRWLNIYQFFKLSERSVSISRITNETSVELNLNLDGEGISKINTGISFFDHMLDQISRHGSIDIELSVKGDLNVDEHHTIEDVAIALGEAFSITLGNKLGIERYGFLLPMDDCLAQVGIDFGGRNWLVWDAKFNREMIGKMPTEMFYHFFKSFSDSSKSNINIKAEGSNEHHKIESIFKAFAKAIKAAIKRDPDKMILPSTKGVV